MLQKKRGLYRFGPFLLNPSKRSLTRDGKPLALAPKTYDLLMLLLESDGRVLRKEELIATLWPDTIVEEANLSFQISTLRKALADGDRAWIETVPRIGYRFTGPSAVEEPETAAAPPQRAEPPRPRFARFAYAAAGVLMCGVVLALLWWRTDAPAGWSSPVRLTAYPGEEITPAFSPDGSRVAFAWNGGETSNYDIYVKLAGEGEPFRLTSDPANEYSPSWSPDGRSIAFLRATSPVAAVIYVKPSLGGAERRLASISQKTSATAITARLAWAPDGKSVVIGGTLMPREEAGLRIVSVTDGSVRPLTTPLSGAGMDLAPAFSPDGRKLGFIRWKEVLQGDVSVVDVNGDGTPSGTPTRLTTEDRGLLGLAWTPDGQKVIYSSGPHLGLRALRISTVSKAGSLSAAENLPFGEDAVSVTVSRSGAVVYSRENHSANIWGLDLPAQGGESLKRVIASTLHNHLPDYSPDGKRIAFASTRSGTEEIWISKSDGTDPLRMTHMNGPATACPRWSPDGSRVLFHSRASGTMQLYVLDPATSAIRKLSADHVSEGQATWSRDGKFVYSAWLGSGGFALWRRAAEQGSSPQLIAHGASFAQESIDGRALYAAAGTRILRMRPDGGPAEELLSDLANTLSFSVTSDGIYYVAAMRGPRSSQIRFYDFRAKSARTLLDIEKRHWLGAAVSPDGKRLLVSVLEDGTSDLVLIERMKPGQQPPLAALPLPFVDLKEK